MIQNVMSLFASELQIIFFFVAGEPQILSALCLFSVEGLGAFMVLQVRI